MSKKNKDNVSDEESIQPRWYHYAIILGGLISIFFIVSFIFEIADSNSQPNLNKTVDLDDTYRYPFERGNVTYNVELNAPLDEIRKFNFTIQPRKLDILNTQSYRFSFDTYNGSDNGQVSISAIKLRRFLDNIYFFNFDKNESFHNTDSITCTNATDQDKVVLFKPRENESGVFAREEGCIVVKSTRPNLMPFVIDDFMVSIMEE